MGALYDQISLVSLSMGTHGLRFLRDFFPNLGFSERSSFSGLNWFKRIFSVIHS